VGADLSMRTDGQTDRQTDIKKIFAFRNFANASEKVCSSKILSLSAVIVQVETTLHKDAVR
jgi:hypothetical protein